MLPLEEYSTAAGLFQNAAAAPVRDLEVECQAGAEAALVLGEDQQGAVAQQKRAIALCQQVAQIEHRLEAAGA